jgi:hypothetical protein
MPGMSRGQIHQLAGGTRNPRISSVLANEQFSGGADDSLYSCLLLADLTDHKKIPDVVICFDKAAKRDQNAKPWAWSRELASRNSTLDTRKTKDVSRPLSILSLTLLSTPSHRHSPAAYKEMRLRYAYRSPR